LFAALEVATGKVTDACHPRHTHLEFLAFLKQVAKTYPRVKLHIVCDNYGTHKHPKVQAWLAKNPRIVLHFTPTSGSWLNMVEIFFSVKDLIAAIEAFIDGWNESCQPIVWTKTADDILAKAHRKQTSNTRHQRIRRCRMRWRGLTIRSASLATFRMLLSNKAFSPAVAMCDS
jgi:hypothetical protein